MGSFYPHLTSRIKSLTLSPLPLGEGKGRGTLVDIAFTPRLDTWRGEERIQMRIRDIRMTSDGGGDASPFR
jgi:hypothetical protein